MPRKKTSSDQKPMIYPMGLWELDSSQYRLKHVPIHIAVEEWLANEFIAHWHDVEAIGFGKSRLEAIESLKADILDLYEDLKTTPDEELSRTVLQAKKLLLLTIEEVKA